MLTRLFNMFDRSLGPWLYHKGWLRFRWSPAKVRTPWLALEGQNSETGAPELSGEVLIGRSGPGRWSVEFPSHWTSAQRDQCASILDYHLVAIPERYPPNYVVYHCGTTANLYGSFGFRVCQPERLPDWHRTGPRF